MPIKPLPITTFKGMNNIKGRATTLDEPKVILNATVGNDGVLQKRSGYTKKLSLTNGHSLWSEGDYLLYVDNGSLYISFDGVSRTSLAVVGVWGERLSYVKVGSLVYISCSTWNGVYDEKTNSVRAWGLVPPAKPTLVYSAVGGLIPGIYTVCLTTEEADGRLSGNSPIAAIELTVVGGITITNFPSGAVAWITDPSGNTFYYAGKISTITAQPGMVKLPSLWSSPPPMLSNLCIHGGRIYGSSGSILYYSKPFGYEWFDIYSDLNVFASDIWMIARTSYGLFVGFEDEVVFVSGTDPKKAEYARVGDGVIKGSLVYCDRMGQDYGDNVPVWMTKSGFVAAQRPIRAYEEGRVTALSQEKIRFDVGSIAASLFRIVDGEPQILSSFPGGSAVGMGDSVTAEVIRVGRVFTNEFDKDQHESFGLGETVTAEIT
jgi:hypothetical protein